MHPNGVALLLGVVDVDHFVRLRIFPVCPGGVVLCESSSGHSESLLQIVPRRMFRTALTTYQNIYSLQLPLAG